MNPLHAFFYVVNSFSPKRRLHKEAIKFPAMFTTRLFWEQILRITKKRSGFNNGNNESSRKWGSSKIRY